MAGNTPDEVPLGSDAEPPERDQLSGVLLAQQGSTVAAELPTARSA